MEVSRVTSGNSGIGYEVVRQLAKEGMVVYLASRDPEKGIAAAAELSSAGDVRPIHLDLADEATLRSAVDQIEREQGRLDLLVNNAGIALLGDTPKTIGIVFQTNLHGLVLLTQLSEFGSLHDDLGIGEDCIAFAIRQTRRMVGMEMRQKYRGNDLRCDAHLIEG